MLQLGRFVHALSGPEKHFEGVQQIGDLTRFLLVEVLGHDAVNGRGRAGRSVDDAPSGWQASDVEPNEHGSTSWWIGHRPRPTLTEA